MSAQEDLRTKSVDPQELLTLDLSALAVMPIEILSTDPRAPAVAASVYEKLLYQLDSIEGLYVIGGDLVLPYADSTLSPEEVARLLGARTFLQTSIQVEDGQWSLKLDHIDAHYGKCSVEDQGCISGIGGELGIAPRFEPSGGLPAMHDLPGSLFELLETSIFPERSPAPEQVHADAQATFLNVALSDQERIEALSELSGPHMGTPDGPYSDAGLERLRGAVAVAAAEIAMNSDDPRVRAHIWKIMTSVDDPYLVRPLLYALANDPDEHVREEATKALGYFLDEPGVGDALDYARNYDASDSVQSIAGEYF